jgi:hypothetical protein
MAENSIFGTVRPPAVFNKKSPFNVFLGGKIIKVEGLDGNLYANKFRTDTSTPLEVKRWPSKGKDAQGNEIPGDPIPQIIITVQTNLKDSDNPADGGERCFYLEKKALSRTEPDGRKVAAFDTDWGAFFKALEDAGTPRNPAVGGELYMAKTGTAPGKGTQERNLWDAKYTPPGAGVFTEDAPSSNGSSEPSPFDQPAADPKETLRAAAKLEINEANSIDDLKRIHAKYASKDIWTVDEWRELGQKQLARPKVAASPFD